MSIPLFFSGSRASVAWTPRNLFAAGEQGAWYDPSDLTTLYQDAAGTTPVTAVEQPVGLMLDKSGRGNHATASADANRPTLKQDAAGAYYLAFNGTSSALATASVDFTATDKATVFAGIRKLSDAGNSVIVEKDGWYSNAPGFSVSASADYVVSDFRSYEFALAGSSLVAQGIYQYTAPITNVLSVSFNISGSGKENQIVARVNGVAPGSTYWYQTTAGSGALPNAALCIGYRSSSNARYLNGRIYSLIVRGAATSAADIVRAENYVNLKSGQVY